MSSTVDLCRRGHGTMTIECLVVGLPRLLSLMCHFDCYFSTSPEIYFRHPNGKVAIVISWPPVCVSLFCKLFYLIYIGLRKSACDKMSHCD